MFTGIITGIGQITHVQPLGDSAAHGKRLQIQAPAGYLDDVENGDSIALNGACMTVTSFDRAASTFTPDRSLADGERITLQSSTGETHTLQVLHTPGHAANHLCLVLEEDGLLFSGDHILNGSTTVIDPPDGNMADYIDSLDRLTQACADHQIAFILPAHGHVLGQAPQAIAQLKAHRLQREAKVLAAMRAAPGGSMEDWVAIAYADVPPRMWPIAQRSLLAHVERIQSLAPGN